MTKIQNYLPTGRIWDVALSILNAVIRLRYVPNIWNPRTLNEHIMSQKWKFVGDLHLAKRVTDKAEIKPWLHEIGLAELEVPTLGVFESVEELAGTPFDGDVIAKSTHGSGSVIIRRRMQSDSFTQAELDEMSGWLKEDYYRRSREPNYKGLKPRIIVEPMLKDENGEPPKDYKIFCAAGNPFMIQVDLDRFTNHTRQLYTNSWKLLNYSMYYPGNSDPIDQPGPLEEALQVAARISAPFHFVRVDFYFLADTLKLGEMTFFPGNGAELFEPRHGDLHAGRLLFEHLRKTG